MLKAKDNIISVSLFIFGLMVSLFFILVFYISFFYAYFFNDYQFHININLFGEASAELILMAVSLAFILYSYVYVFRKEVIG